MFICFCLKSGAEKPNYAADAELLMLLISFYS